MKILVAYATVQTGLPRRFFVQPETAGYSVNSVKRLFKRDQLRPRLDIRSVIVHFADEAQPTKVLDFLFTLDVFQVPTASEN